MGVYIKAGGAATSSRLYTGAKFHIQPCPGTHYQPILTIIVIIMYMREGGFVVLFYSIYLFECHFEKIMAGLARHANQYI